MRTSKLSAVLLGNEYYFQIISEFFDNKKDCNTIIKTYSEAGHLVSENTISSQPIANTYYSKFVEDVVDKIERGFTLQTLNNEGKVVLSQNILRRPTEHIVDEHTADILQEIFYADNKRHLSLLRRESDKRESIVLTEHKPAQSFDLKVVEARNSMLQERRATNASLLNQYNVSITKDAINKTSSISKNPISEQNSEFKQKLLTPNLHVTNRTSPKKSESRYLSEQRPHAATLLGSLHYTEMISELMHEDYDSYSMEESQIGPPTLVANNYYNDLLCELANKRSSFQLHDPNAVVVGRTSNNSK